MASEAEIFKPKTHGVRGYARYCEIRLAVHSDIFRACKRVYLIDHEALSSRDHTRTYMLFLRA